MLGSPIAHSLSPVLHRAAYAGLGLTTWCYDRVEMSAEGLPHWLAGLGPEWVGLSLTMPCKQAALQVADHVDPTAALVGAANTLLRRPRGGWAAVNTDVSGVRATLVGAGLTDSTALGGLRGEHGTVVIGSGATARAVLAALAGLGVSAVDLVVRQEVRPQTVRLADRLGLRVRVRREAELTGVLGGARLVVSTVPDASSLLAVLAPVGALGRPVDESRHSGRLILFDVVYAGWPTPIARWFSSAGARVVGGLELLVQQGAEQVRLMTGLEPDIEAMRAAGQRALSQGRPPD